MAAAGVGHIAIADPDVVEISNLHRQVLFGFADVGLPKAQIAAQKLALQHPDINFEPLCFGIDNQNALSLFHNYDLILDGSDNFETRYLVNDACFLLKKTLIYGAVHQYEGQVSVFNYFKQDGATHRPCNYRDLFPDLPKANQFQNCAEGGVLGVLPAIVGGLQAAEAIKIITGIGAPLTNKLLVYSFLEPNFYQIELLPNPRAEENMPSDFAEFKQRKYEQLLCSINDGRDNENNNYFEISWGGVEAVVNELKMKSGKTIFIDVRFEHEQPKLTKYSYLNIPLPELSNYYPDLTPYDSIFCFCQTGKRSAVAAEQIRKNYPNKSVFNIAGGIQSL